MESNNNFVCLLVIPVIFFFFFLSLKSTASVRQMWLCSPPLDWTHTGQQHIHIMWLNSIVNHLENDRVITVFSAALNFPLCYQGSKVNYKLD